MSTTFSSPTRRNLLAAAAAAGAAHFLPVQMATAGGARASRSSNQGAAQMSAAKADAILPFRANVSEEALVDLRRRIAATRWPDKETVADQSQGAQLAKLQDLVRYWGGRRPSATA